MAQILTPFGGMVPWAAYTKHIGIIDTMAADCPVQRTSPNAAPVYEVLQSFMLTALPDGRRFSNIERLREDRKRPPEISYPNDNRWDMMSQWQL
jgi:hypothetical protein